MREFILAYDLNTVKPFTAWVIEDILYNHEDNPNYVYEVIKYGCESGIVSSLTYYYQTESIFKEFYKDILAIYDQCKLDVNFEINANNLVWLAYEVICNELYYGYQMVAD